MLAYADAVVVGSAIVQIIESNPGESNPDRSAPTRAVARAGERYAGLVAAVEKLAREFQPQSASLGESGLAAKENH